jgi:hypothetical protein
MAPLRPLTVVAADGDRRCAHVAPEGGETGRTWRSLAAVDF